MPMTLAPAYDNSRGIVRESRAGHSARAERDPDHRRVIQVIGENVCGRAWIYATLML